MVDTYQGSLFSGDFLTDSITRLPDWAEVWKHSASGCGHAISDHRRNNSDTR